jgi:predicted AAA+ superfamily ATPase
VSIAQQFHQAFDGIVHYFDLENPMLALEDLTGLIVIDEIQRRPNLFPPVRVFDRST